ASLDVNELTIVTVKSSAGALAVSVQAAAWAPKIPLDARAAMPVRERLSAAWTALDRTDEVLEATRPATVLVAGKVTPEHERYLALKELADSIGDTLNNYENRLEDRKHSYLEAAQPEATGRRARYRAIKIKHLDPIHGSEQPLKSLAAAESM